MSSGKKCNAIAVALKKHIAANMFLRGPDNLPVSFPLLSKLPGDIFARTNSPVVRFDASILG